MTVSFCCFSSSIAKNIHMERRICKRGKQKTEKIFPSVFRNHVKIKSETGKIFAETVGIVDAPSGKT